MKLKLTVFIFVFLILTLVAVFQGMNQTTDVRSKAANPEPINIPTVVPAPKTLLTPPYIRFVTNKEVVSSGERVPVDVYAMTSEPVVEAYFSLHYDPDVLSFSEQDVVPEHIFPILNIERIENGDAQLSLFLSGEEGYGPVVFPKEQKVATFFFTVRNNSVKETTITLKTTGETATGLFIPRDGQTGETKNIINSSEGVTFKVE